MTIKKMTSITNKSVLSQATRGLAVLAAFCFLELPCQAAVSVEQLRCEYRTAPLGLDVAKPRLSWLNTSTDRGVCQTAYQVLVAST
jgi:alpha-L-rhamnosidase